MTTSLPDEGFFWWSAVARRNFIITYDIADDKRRNRIFDLLLDNGNHTQFSVFLCQLSRSELMLLRGSLQEIAHEREDQILIVDLGKVEFGEEAKIDYVGRCYEPPIRTRIV